MCNFKVGDKVRVKKLGKPGYHGAQIGDTGIIKKIGHNIGVEFDISRPDFHSLGDRAKLDHGYWCTADMLELVEDVFTKDDIEPGYVVELRNGNITIANYTADGILIIVDEHNSWTSLDHYNEDLTFKSRNHNHDIIKIYGYSKWAYRVLNYETKERSLLWERKEEKKPEPKKLTVAEIEKELGYSIEIIPEGAENE